MKSGQALVVVLLILAVAAAVGLSIVSRSVNEVNLSTTQTDSSQALSAAESGIQAVLQNPALSVTGTPAPTPAGNNSTYTLVNTAPYGNTTSFVLANSLLSGEYATLFLQTVSTSGSFQNSGQFYFCDSGGSSSCTGTVRTPASMISFCWNGTAAGTGATSIEVSLYYRDSAGVNHVTHHIYDPTGHTSGALATPITTSGSNVGNCGIPAPTQYDNGTTLFTTQTGVQTNWMPSYSQSTYMPYFIRVRTLYNSVPTPLAVSSSSQAFPQQGTVYEIQGSAGQANRRVSVTQKFPAPPGILDNAIFSGNNL